jgi:aminoglycoside 3-N-acetyltransferase
MISFRELAGGLRSLDIPPASPLIVHASLSAFGEVRGGVDTLLGSLLGEGRGVMAPAFTYKTMLVPEIGPENNGITYGSGRDLNQMAEFFRQDMPADPAMGVLAEALRRRPNARRSEHPVLSFTGVNIGEALQAQGIRNPLGPVGVLLEKDGWVLLMGVGHDRNTSIHYAEKLAGRKQFIRWALTLQGVVECPGWPGCSDGFGAASAVLEKMTRKVRIGPAAVQAIPLAPMVEEIVRLLRREPLALLCEDGTCERCRAVRLAGATALG